jgi:hypothetical protein
MKQSLILAALVIGMASCGNNADKSHDTGIGPKDSSTTTKLDPVVSGTDNGAVVNPNNITDTAGSKTNTIDSIHNGHVDKKDTSKKRSHD